MRSTASTHKFATAIAALSLAAAIVIFTPVLALGEAVRNSGSNGSRVGNWASAPLVSKSKQNQLADDGLRIRIIERAEDQQSCQNTLFIPARPGRCQSESPAIAFGETGNVEAKSSNQKTLVPDVTTETTILRPSTDQKPTLAKSIARLEVDESKSVKPKSVLDPKPVKSEAVENDQPQSPSPLSCDKVSAIVGDYGFNGMRASDCDGQVYSFNANRDGKPFVISLNSASGELIAVRKIPLDTSP